MKKKIQKHIDIIKEKPLEERKRVAHILALIVTVIIVLLWLALVFFIFPNKKERKPLVNTTSMESFVDAAGDRFEKLGGILSQQKETIGGIKDKVQEKREQEIFEEDIENSLILITLADDVTIDIFEQSIAENSSLEFLSFLFNQPDLKIALVEMSADAILSEISENPLYKYIEFDQAVTLNDPVINTEN